MSVEKKYLEAQEGKEQSTTSKELKNLETDVRKERIKKYLKIDGQKDEKLQVEALPWGDKKFAVSFDYKFKDKNGNEVKSFPLQLIVSIVTTQNNSFMKVERLQTKEWRHIGIKDWIGIANRSYDISITQLPKYQKNFEVGFEYNEYRTEKKLCEKISAVPFKNTLNIQRDPELENTQLTALNNISLGKEVVRVSDKERYRSIFIHEGKSYRELGKVYFNENGKIDKSKTMTENKSCSILNIPVKFDLQFLGEKNESINLGLQPEAIKKLTEKVKKHRNIIKNCAGNTRIGDPKIFEGLNNEGWFWNQTDRIGLNLVENSYTLKRGKADADVFPFTFSENDDISFKDRKGNSSDTYTVRTEKNGKVAYKEVKLERDEKEGKEEKGGKLVITNESSEYLAPTTYPALRGDIPNALAKWDLVEADPQDHIAYFTTQGENITTIPAKRNEQNEWELGTLAENVDSNDFLKMENILKNHNLLNYNLTDSDLRSAFQQLLQKTWINLTNRSVIKVRSGNGYVYRRVEQKAPWAEMILTKDEELEAKVTECKTILANNLNILKTLSNTSLLLKEGKQKEDFYTYIGGKEGIWLHALKGSETADFIGKSPDEAKQRMLSRTLTWGEGESKGNTQEIQFIITKNNKIKIDGKGCFRPKKVAGIEQKTYTITYNNENNTSELLFEVKK